VSSKRSFIGCPCRTFGYFRNGVSKFVKQVLTQEIVKSLLFVEFPKMHFLFLQFLFPKASSNPIPQNSSSIEIEHFLSGFRSLLTLPELQTHFEASPSLLNKASLSSGQTPLLAAILSGNDAAVKFLLAKPETDCLAKEKDGYSAFHAAAFQGREAILRRLIEMGERCEGERSEGQGLRGVHKDGYEPAFRACWTKDKRHRETFRVFIENGVVFDAIGGKGETLAAACEGYGLDL